AAGLRVDGVWTHLATSEDLADPFTTTQLGRFGAAVNELATAGIRPRLLHAANSAAALARPEARFDGVRVGLAMYGVAPGGEDGPVEAADALVLVGGRGEEAVTVTGLSDPMGTTPCEVVCGVSERVPREYVGERPCGAPPGSGCPRWSAWPGWRWGPWRGAG